MPASSDGPGERPARRLNGHARVLAYVAEHPDRADLVADALEAICADTQHDRWPTLPYLPVPGAEVVLLDGEELVLVWRSYADFRAYFQVVYIGPIDQGA